MHIADTVLDDDCNTIDEMADWPAARAAIVARCVCVDTRH